MASIFDKQLLSTKDLERMNELDELYAKATDEKTKNAIRSQLPSQRKKLNAMEEETIDNGKESETPKYKTKAKIIDLPFHNCLHPWFWRSERCRPYRT